MSALLLTNVELPSGQRGDIRIAAGQIAELGAGLAAAPEVPRIDGQGWLVLPAAIDWHVHFRDPGAPHKETLWSGSRAAVKGGVATCGDMPNTNPHTTTMRALEDKVARAQGCPAHLYFHFGAEPDNLADVRAAARHPRVKALKIFMGPSTGHGGLPPEAVAAHFKNAADIGLPVIVHAEDLDLIQAQAGHFPALAAHHGVLRPLAAELAAVEQALALAAQYPVRLCIAHSTSAQVLELVRRSGLGERVSVEVTLHHLALSSGHIAPPADNRLKVNPPLRPEAERAALFARLGAGIDSLGSDHAPHTLAEKAQPYGSAPSGIPGVEYQFAFAIHWWRQGIISRERLLALTSGNVSRFFGLNKGAVAPGTDADLVLVDPGAVWTVGEEDDAVASRCGWTPYGGTRLQGRVEATIVEGKLAWTRACGWTEADRPGGAGSTGTGSGGGGAPVHRARSHADECCG